MKNLRPRLKLSSAAAPLFPIVGIGASAGGLEAFTQLLQAAARRHRHGVRPHPAPRSDAHELPAARRWPRRPRCRSARPSDGTRVEPNHVYVIPPNADIAILDGPAAPSGLAPTSKRAAAPAHRLLLARARRRIAAATRSASCSRAPRRTAPRASGPSRRRTASPSRRIPKSAKFAGMPRSAIDAGVVDHCLPIPELAAELVRLSRHPLRLGAQAGARRAADDGDARTRSSSSVRNAVGVDFSEYKAADLRAAARAAAWRCAGVDEPARAT